MKLFFLALGLLWIFASAVSGFIGRPAGPSNGELLAVVFITGGALLLGVSFILVKLGEIEKALSSRGSARETAEQSPATL